MTKGGGGKKRNKKKVTIQETSGMQGVAGKDDIGNLTAQLIDASSIRKPNG